MRISAAAEQLGVPARLLRYYEEQGLVDPARDQSGYRVYSDRDLVVIGWIRQLLEIGLSTATIATMLPCLTDRAGQLAPTCNDLVDELRSEQARIANTIASLNASRERLGQLVAAGESN